MSLTTVAFLSFAVGVTVGAFAAGVSFTAFVWHSARRTGHS